MSIRLALFLAAVCSALPAQSNSTQAGVPQFAGATATEKAPALQERHPRYRVMPSDVLAISFPLSTELNSTVTIQPDGYITLPNVGSVYAQGETVSEIVETLKTAYAKILHDPIIAVDLTNFQKPQFTVNGQVGKPGQYELRADTTVSERYILVCANEPVDDLTERLKDLRATVILRNVWIRKFVTIARNM